MKRMLVGVWCVCIVQCLAADPEVESVIKTYDAGVARLKSTYDVGVQKEKAVAIDRLKVVVNARMARRDLAAANTANAVIARLQGGGGAGTR